MIPGIYEIKNKLDGMPYGGRAGHIEQRWKNHLSMLRRNKHHCIHLQRAWNKYGEDAFEFLILEEIENPGERLAAEQKWLDVHWPNCYNTARYAAASGQGRIASDETRQKLREAAMGNQYAVGYKHTEEQNRASSERMMGNQYGVGYTHTDEWKQALSERMMGKQYAMGSKHTEKQRREQRAFMVGNQYALGSKRTEEQSQAQSERLMGNQNTLGYKHTEEFCQAQSERMMGHEVSDKTKAKIGAASAKPYPAFVHRDTGEVIPAGRNLKRMCRERGLRRRSMGDVKNGKQSHHKGWGLIEKKEE